MNECGCHIKANPVEIVYCPLHKAAPEMLEALRALKIVDGGIKGMGLVRKALALSVELTELEQAIETAREALGYLRENERELGWSLARAKLEKEDKMGFLLDDEKEG